MSEGLGVTARTTGGRWVRRAGGFRLAEWLTRGVPRIFMYHRFARLPAWRKTAITELDATLAEMRRYCRMSSLDNVVEAICSGAQLDPRSVVVTVDDAYEDFYRLALPIFEFHRVPVTLFVPTDFVDGSSWLWADRLHWAISNTERAVIVSGGRRFGLATLAQRRVAWNALADTLLELDASGRAAAFEEIERQLSVSVPDRPSEEYRPMNWSQLVDAAGRGVCIGSQAGAHIPLAREGAAIQASEAARSKRILEEKLQREIRHFSYPHGRLRDFDRITQRAAADAGYRSAAAAVPEAGRDNLLFALPRVGAPTDPSSVRMAASGMAYLSEWIGR